jgi:hypothetical protein
VGLADVGAEGRVFMAQVGSPGTDLVRANYEQLRGAMIDSGEITAGEIDQDLARLGEEPFFMPSSIMWAAWGRRVR